MKQDIKNVIITFGLIATALVSGSFLYRKKIENENILALQQEQFQNIINEQQVLLDQLSLQTQMQTVASTENIATPPAPKVVINKRTPAVVPKASTPNPNPTPTPKTQPVVQSNPVVLAPPATPKPTVAPTPTPTAPKVVTSTTRKSRAS